MQKWVRYSDVNTHDAEVDIAANPISTSSETTNSSDCFSVSHYYVEFDFSSTSCLLAAGAARDNVETESSHSDDVFCELVSSEGSESESNTLSDGAEEDANSMRDFIREAVLRKK